MHLIYTRIGTIKYTLGFSTLLFCFSIYAQEVKLTIKHIYDTEPFTEISNSTHAYNEHSHDELVVLEQGPGEVNPLPMRLRRLRRDFNDKYSLGGAGALPPTDSSAYYSNPGSDLFEISPDGKYLLAYYRQNDAPVLDHYHLMILTPLFNNSIVQERVWTPQEHWLWWAGWCDTNDFFVAYPNTVGAPSITVDTYSIHDVDGPAGTEWMKASHDYPVPRNYSIIADGHYDHASETLLLTCVVDDEKQNPSNAKDFAPRWDLLEISPSTNSVKMVHFETGDGLACFLNKVGNNIYYLSVGIDRGNRIAPESDTRRHILRCSLVMRGKDRQITRSVSVVSPFSDRGVSSYFLQKSNMIVVCINEGMSAVIDTKRGEPEPREIELPDAFETKEDLYANWIFFDADTLTVVDNWLIKKNLISLQYSAARNAMVTCSTKYKYINPELGIPGMIPRKALQSRLLLLSFGNDDAGR